MSWYKRGLIYLDAKDYNRAAVNFSHAGQYKPDMAEAFYNLGLCYYHKQQFDRAIEAFSSAIAADSTHSKAFYNRSLTYALHQKKYFLAWKDLLQAKAKGYNVDSTYYHALAGHFKTQSH